MKYIVEQLLTDALAKLKAQNILPTDLAIDIKVDRTKEISHGDFATNLALLLAKPCQKSPRQIADLIINTVAPHPSVERIEIAGPGFINFFLRNDTLLEIIAHILKEQDRFGCSNLGQNKKIILEFVSANPTGPLHVGHGRGAAFGATLANILKAAGYHVSCEYYVNDAGRQMDILAASVWLRYVALTGEDIVFPTNAYRGSYVQDIAKDFLHNHDRQYSYPWSVISQELPPDEPQGGDKEIYIDAIIARMKSLLGISGFNLFHKQALDCVLADIKDDLDEFGVHFDCWFSERSLLEGKAIEKGINTLKQSDHTYEDEGALWFKAREFGDEKDRVLIRANGQTTYFASDVAYHWDKYNRGFDRVIDIFGADHHGYVTRVRAAVTALGHDEQALDVMLVQFAILYRGGERMQMSTRSGSFVTLRELREEVGNDAARFFYVMRKPEQHMDFDLDLAKSKSNENPVYYIQYAHARICSVFRQLQERGHTFNMEQGLQGVNQLAEPAEIALLTLLSRYPETINLAASNCEPHQLAYYLRELANGLHSYYNAIILLCDDESIRNARLCLLSAVRQVLRNGLQLLGVSTPESM
ncbi:arginine tRNA synthetase [Legionella beliardensis]|uniref:Arginine--tRNA ligase n=1 Tax=Legionella beliardensis TaxID=91822 RepID=A0A378HZB1_9GAMM|nr:arginine--tRNA ligase [Legionella beliardensis]STX28092.1 arginine tRNA synthetase [Legionella beliardensis]